MLPISQNDLNIVYHLFSTITPVTETDVNNVGTFLKKTTYHKGEKILDIAQTETRINFVIKGIVHMYTFVDGDAFTINISLPGMLFNSLDSYINSRPTNDIQEAVTEVEIIYLEKKDVEILLKQNNSFAYIYAKLYEQVLNTREQRTLLLQYNSAHKRYNHFIHNIAYAERYVLEVPQKLVAHYLGLAPETYCRIKKQFLKK
jgi:CRP/FNR family transcriptional regulator, anaerobic regulatory protein